MVHIIGDAPASTSTEVLALQSRLKCSISSAINQHVTLADQHTIDWAIKHGLVHTGGKKFERFRASQFTWLAARSYPLVSRHHLELVSDWITFLFFYDDMCDTRKVYGDPDYREK